MQKSGCDAGHQALAEWKWEFWSSCGQDRWFAAQPSLEIHPSKSPAWTELSTKCRKIWNLKSSQHVFFHLSRNCMNSDIAIRLQLFCYIQMFTFVSALSQKSGKGHSLLCVYIYISAFTMYVKYSPCVYPFAWERYIHWSLRPDTSLMLSCLQW